MLSNGLSNESNIAINYIKYQDQGFKKIINEIKPNAVLCSSDNNVFFSKYGRARFYLPPKSEDSTFGLSIDTMAYRKGFQYKHQFDKM